MLNVCLLCPSAGDTCYIPGDCDYGGNYASNDDCVDRCLSGGYGVAAHYSNGDCWCCCN